MTNVPAANTASTVPDVPSGNSGRSKLILLMLVISAAGAAAWLLRDELSLQKLAVREAAFRSFQIDHPAVVYVAAFAAYVVVVDWNYTRFADGGTNNVAPYRPAWMD
jgi:hypothetical protein